MVPKCYTNWNAARSKNGEKFEGVPELDRNLLARLNMKTVLELALTTGDFQEVDALYNYVIESSCRHQAHTGPIGKFGRTATAKDKCASIKRVLDKEKMAKKKAKGGKNANKKIYKNKPVCKRRKPQPLIDEKKIYADPYKKTMHILSTASNDGFFNGACPDRILFHLANSDDKAIIPGLYIKPPKVIFSAPNGITMTELEFYLTGEDQADYMMKYSTKGPAGAKMPTDI